MNHVLKPLSRQHYFSSLLEGVGVTRWRPIEAARYLEPNGRLVLFAELLDREADLSDAEKESLEDLSWTTFDRFLDSPRLREALCVEVTNGQLVFSAPRSRVIGAIRDIAFRVMEGEFNSRDHDTVEQRLAALEQVTETYLPKRREGEPDPVSVTSVRQVEDEPQQSVDAPPQKAAAETSSRYSRTRAGRPDDRLFKKAEFRISDPRAAGVFRELCETSVSKRPNTCAVMLRVFLELSLVLYLQSEGQGTIGRGGQPAELHLLFERAFKHLQNTKPGVSLPEIEELIASRTSQVRIRELHQYVHKPYIYPAPADLLAMASELTNFLRELWTKP